MNDREIMEAAIRHMKDPAPDPDENKSFLRQLWDNLRLSFWAKKKDAGIEAKTSAKF